jgi:Tol biopolymer transport system component
VPQFLPDGRRFLFSIQSRNANRRGVYAGSLDHPDQRTRILATDRKVIYAPSITGHPAFLLWLRDRTIVAQRLDERSLRLEGDAIPLSEEVASGAGLRAAFWASPAGLLAWRSGGHGHLVWIARDGKRVKVGKDESLASFNLTPDGVNAVLSITDSGGNSDLWILDLARQTRTRLTYDRRVESTPIWTPDARQVVYAADRGGTEQLFRQDARGGAPEQKLTDGPDGKLPFDISRDGRSLLYGVQSGDSATDLWVLSLVGERKPAPLVQTPASDGWARFSPDGRWIAYESSISGIPEVYVRPFPGGQGEWQVSAQGGRRPRWRADGKEIYFLSLGSDKVMAAGTRPAGTDFQSDPPRELFPIDPFPQRGLSSPFEVTGDGQRFLVLQPSADTVSGALTVVTHWQAGLKK